MFFTPALRAGPRLPRSPAGPGGSRLRTAAASGAPQRSPAAPLARADIGEAVGGAARRLVPSPDHPSSSRRRGRPRRPSATFRAYPIATDASSSRPLYQSIVGDEPTMSRDPLEIEPIRIDREKLAPSTVILIAVPVFLHCTLCQRPSAMDGPTPITSAEPDVPPKPHDA